MPPHTKQHQDAAVFMLLLKFNIAGIMPFYAACTISGILYKFHNSVTCPRIILHSSRELLIQMICKNNFQRAWKSHNLCLLYVQYCTLYNVAVRTCLRSIWLWLAQFHILKHILVYLPLRLLEHFKFDTYVYV